MSEKTIVELDLVGYSSVSRMLEENIDTAAVAQLNEQVQTFVDKGLAAISAERDKVVMATTGDGAILVFDDPADAHHFAIAVHAATQAHNAGRTQASAQRWFRIGAATGTLHQRPRLGGGQEIAGTVIANAVRLESAARPGEVVIDRQTFELLPENLQTTYGPEEIVAGKREERFNVRRQVVVPYSTPEDGPPTINTILPLFDSLNPRDQMRRLILLIGMPPQFRPPDTLELYRRQDMILDWAYAQGEQGLVKLATALKDLIRDQQLPRS